MNTADRITVLTDPVATKRRNDLLCSAMVHDIIVRLRAARNAGQDRIFVNMTMPVQVKNQLVAQGYKVQGKVVFL